MKHPDKPLKGGGSVFHIDVAAHTKSILAGVRAEPVEALECIALLLSAQIAGGALPPTLTEQQKHIICACAAAKLLEVVSEVMGDDAVKNIARDN